MATRERPGTELIDRYIEPNPHKPGEAEVRLRGSGVSVWVIVDYWSSAGFDKQQVANDFDLPLEAVEAALAYYKVHKLLVDARIALNSV
jgi:uncharacterized protein (DUF433 family)